MQVHKGFCRRYYVDTFFVVQHSYYIYPTAIDRIETKKFSRKFPIVLYDIREIDNLIVDFQIYIQHQEENTELKVVDKLPLTSASPLSETQLDELPVVEEEEKSESANMESASDPIQIAQYGSYVSYIVDLSLPRWN